MCFVVKLCFYITFSVACMKLEKRPRTSSWTHVLMWLIDNDPSCLRFLVEWHLIYLSTQTCRLKFSHFCLCICICSPIPLLLWHCWLDDRNGIGPVKNSHQQSSLEDMWGIRATASDVRFHDFFALKYFMKYFWNISKISRCCWTTDNIDQNTHNTNKQIGRYTVL